MDKYEIKPVVDDYNPVFVSIKEMQDNRNENEQEYDLTELFASNLLHVKSKKLIPEPARKKIVLEEDTDKEEDEETEQETKQEAIYETKPEKKDKRRKTSRPVKASL